ncbi:chemotaxis protein [Candidatus Dependentiae bacterium]|nr:chemotaxis protein [Candidatus Dependentiae bacterium]
MKKIRLILLVLFMLITSIYSWADTKADTIKETELEIKETFDIIEGKGIRRIISRDKFTVHDCKIIDLATNCAKECSATLEKAIDEGIKSEEEIFSTLYFPVTPVTSPPTYTTFYDDYTDEAITPIEDKYLTMDSKIIFVVLVDRNGYLPSHNTIFSQPRTGDVKKDLKINRTKRIFNDITGFSAAKNKAPVLLQLYKRDTGELIADLSVPVYVKGKHWGALRIGFIREDSE